MRLSHNKAEERYSFIFVTILVLFPLVFCAGFILLPTFVGDLFFGKPFLAGVVYFALLFVAVYVSPHNDSDGPKLMPTLRAIRLLLAAVLVELILVLIGVGTIHLTYGTVSDPNNSPEAGILAIPFIGFMVLVAIMIGPIVYVLTPYTLPLAGIVTSAFDTVLDRD